MYLRSVLVAAAITPLALVAAGESRAADLPLKARVAPAVTAASFNWAGPYVGVFGGYGWGRARATEPTDPNLFFPFYNGTDVPYSFDAQGFFGGGTLGYNLQSGALVYGLEGEVGYLGLRGSVDRSQRNDLFRHARHRHQLQVRFLWRTLWAARRRR